MKVSTHNGVERNHGRGQQRDVDSKRQGDQRRRSPRWTPLERFGQRTCDQKKRKIAQEASRAPGEEAIQGHIVGMGVDMQDFGDDKGEEDHGKDESAGEIPTVVRVEKRPYSLPQAGYEGPHGGDGGGGCAL